MADQRVPAGSVSVTGTVLTSQVNGYGNVMAPYSPQHAQDGDSGRVPGSSVDGRRAPGHRTAASDPNRGKGFGNPDGIPGACQGDEPTVYLPLPRSADHPIPKRTGTYERTRPGKGLDQ